MKTKNAQSYDKYFELLVEYNQRYNLTSIVDRDAVSKKHFEDSLLGENLVVQNATLLDVGCGAGFPSIPLCIQRPDIKATLCDSVKKKLDFVDIVVKELGLQYRVQTVHTRAEDIKQREFFDCCVSRAVAKLNTLVELTLPFVKVGGVLIAYKSNDIAQELEEAQNAITLLGAKLQNIEEYQLDEQTVRKIVVIKKVKQTDPKYPRKKNLPRTKPI